MENGDPRSIPAIVALLVLILPIIVVWLWAMIKQWLEDTAVENYHLDNEDYTSQFNTGKKTRIEKYLKKNKQIDRERPPNASFFCRVGGKETFIEGPYEEQWLNRYEMIKWKYKKKKRELKKKKV